MLDHTDLFDELTQFSLRYGRLKRHWNASLGRKFSGKAPLLVRCLTILDAITFCSPSYSDRKQFLVAEEVGNSTPKQEFATTKKPWHKP